MTFMTLEVMIQRTRLMAGRLRFLMCQMKDGMSMRRVMKDSTGTAIAPGESPSSGTKPSIAAVLLAISTMLPSMLVFLLIVAVDVK